MSGSPPGTRIAQVGSTIAGRPQWWWWCSGAIVLAALTALLWARGASTAIPVRLHRVQPSRLHERVTAVSGHIAARRMVGLRADASARVDQLYHHRGEPVRSGDPLVGLTPRIGSRWVVHAPFAGTLISTQVEPGEVVAPGLPLLTLADLSILHVEAEFDESDAARLNRGMEAEVTVEALHDLLLRGTVEDLAPSVNLDRSGSRTVQGRIALHQAASPRLLLGMSVGVDVTTMTHDSALGVPVGTLYGGETQRVVFILEGNRARRREVTLGIVETDVAEVIRGLAPGEQVLEPLSPQGLFESAEVVVREERSAAR